MHRAKNVFVLPSPLAAANGKAVGLNKNTSTGSGQHEEPPPLKGSNWKSGLGSAFRYETMRLLVTTDDLFSSISLPRVSRGSACCSASDGWISEGSMIPLIASLKPFVKSEWWWSGSIRAVMTPRGAAEGQDLRETKGNTQLLQIFWLPCWHLTRWVIGGVLLWMPMVVFGFETDNAEICSQFAALPSICVCLFVFWWVVGFFSFFFFLWYVASADFPVLWLSCGRAECWCLQDAHLYIFMHISDVQ